MQTKGKKRNKFIIATEIIMFLCCIAIVVSVFVLKDAGNVEYRGNVRTGLDINTLNDGWYEVTDDGDIPFTNFYNPIDQDKLVLKHDFSWVTTIKGNDENKTDTGELIDSIGFTSFFSVVYIEYYDASKDKIVEIKNYGGDGRKTENGTDPDSFAEDQLVGNYYIITQMPKDVDEETDYLLVTFYNTRDEIYVYNFETGTEGDLTKGLISEYFSVIIITVLALVFIFVIILLKFSKRTGKYVTLSHIYFAIFFLCYAIYEILDSQYLIVLGLPAGSVTFGSLEFYSIFTVGLVQFTYATCRWKKAGKVIDVVICLLIFLNFMAINAAYFLEIHSLYDVIFSSHILGITSILNCIIQVFACWIKSFNTRNEDLYREKKFLGATLLGALIFAITAGYQFYNFYIDPSKSNSTYLRIGVIAFGLIVVINIVRKINDEVEYERKENLNRIWEEKQKVEDIRSIMNDAFKTIIPEQYIDEVIEAYKRKNKIKNDSIDGTVPEEDMILKIGHSRRLATILVSDVRGFSEISTKYDQRVGDMLSHYLGNMTDIVEKYGGHVLEFMGDGILAGFGTIEQDKYQADNAVKAAIEMQSTMAEINRWNEANGFPGQLEIGIGINTGNVFAGIIGSLERFKFDVLGREVNLASRIESFTTGGQILISQKTKESIIEPVGTYDVIKATPKGFDTEQTYYLVNAVGDMRYEIKGEEFTPFRTPIEVKFSVFEDKGNAKKTFSGTVTEMSEHAIVLKTTALLDIFDIVKVIHNGGVTCKVTKIEEKGYTLRFTSSSKRNDGRPIFEELDEDEAKLDELDPETRKLIKKKKDNYSF